MRVFRRVGLLVCLSYLACAAASASSNDLQKTRDDLDNTIAAQHGGWLAPSHRADELQVGELPAAARPTDHLSRAQQLAANGQHQQAISEFTESIKDDTGPGFSASWSTYVQQHGDDFEVMAEDRRRGMKNRLCQDYYGRAYEYSQVGMHSSAVEDYRVGMRVDPDFSASNPSVLPDVDYWQADYIAANPWPACRAGWALACITEFMLFVYVPFVIAAWALAVLFSVSSVIVAIRSRLFLQILLLPLLIAGVFSPGTDTSTLLHFGISAIAAYSAFRFRSLAWTSWVWFYGLIAAFYNPFLRVHMGESTWSAVDVACALVLLGSFFPLARRVRKTRITQSPLTEPNETAPNLMPHQANRAIDRHLAKLER